MTQTETVMCVFCGRSPPISKASFKKGEVEHLGELSIHECKGRLGFPLVERKPLISCIGDPRCKKLLFELLDMASGVIAVAIDHNLPIDDLGFIKKYRSLENKLKDKELEEEGLQSDLDDAYREIENLKRELSKMDFEVSGRQILSDDWVKEKKDLMEKDNKLAMRVNDLIRENNQLKADIRYYESKAFSDGWG